MKSQTFTDFDAFVETVHDVDCVMMLQNPQHYFWSITHIYLPGIHVQLGRLGSGNIVEGQSLPDGYLIYLPLTHTCKYLANGQAVDQHSFVVLEPGCEFCISTKFEHDWCSVYIPSSLFNHAGILLERASGYKKMNCRVTPANRQFAQRFLIVIKQILAAADHSQFESSLAATRAQTELLTLASLIVGESSNAYSHRTGRPKVSRKKIIHRSKVFFEEKDGERFQIIELAQAAGVSERTLRTAFNDYYGVGPVRYQRLREIHLVHQALLAADPEEVSVTDVLIQQGQWEFGRFSGQYRQFYGELPSDTLHRKR